MTGYVRDSNGRLRYRVRDINKHTKSYGAVGYLTTNVKYVQNAYYQSKYLRIKVINSKGLNEYRNKNLSGKVKHDKKGSTLRVKKLVGHNLSTRFVLQNGHFVSANKKLVVKE